MSVSASVTSQSISASVSAGGNVSASVPSAPAVQATVGGGVGPQGAQGPQGPAGVTAISQLSDSLVSSPTNGDVLRYSEGKWRNYNESQLLDGQNF